MRRNSPFLLFALILAAACGGGDAYRRIRVELPSYSPLHLEEFEKVVFGSFLIGKETAGLDLNKEISEYFATEFERKLHYQVTVQPLSLESEEFFRNSDFWKSLAPGSGRLLYVTGKAEMTQELRKAIVDKAKNEIETPWDQQKGIAERTVFSLNLHIYLIRGDSGEVVLDRDFQESRAYTGANPRADFAFYDLAQRVRSKLFRSILSEERIQERYLLLK